MPAGDQGPARAVYASVAADAEVAVADAATIDQTPDSVRGFLARFTDRKKEKFNEAVNAFIGSSAPVEGDTESRWQRRLGDAF